MSKFRLMSRLRLKPSFILKSVSVHG
jgi:hypothetical protein